MIPRPQLDRLSALFALCPRVFLIAVSFHSRTSRPDTHTRRLPGAFPRCGFVSSHNARCERQLPAPGPRTGPVRNDVSAHHTPENHYTLGEHTALRRLSSEQMCVFHFPHAVPVESLQSFCAVLLNKVFVYKHHPVSQNRIIYTVCVHLNPHTRL